MQIYVRKKGKQLGPYSLEQVKQLLAHGGLQPANSAWYDGLYWWIPLSEVPGVPKVIRQKSRGVYGTFWVRFGAQGIDGLLVFVLMIIGLVLFGFLFETDQQVWRPLGGGDSRGQILQSAPSGFVGVWRKWFFNLLDLEMSLSTFIAGHLLPAVYFIGFNIRKSATPGKMWRGLKIVDAETGRKPTVRQFIGRYFAMYLSAVPFGLGSYWVAWDKRKQSFHDHLAGTVVVKTW